MIDLLITDIQKKYSQKYTCNNLLIKIQIIIQISLSILLY